VFDPAEVRGESVHLISEGKVAYKEKVGEGLGPAPLFPESRSRIHTEWIPK
jgi:hypothetical protein